MALDLQDLNDENALNIETINKYDDTISKMKKESEDNILEFETKINNIRTKHKNEKFAMQNQIDDCLREIEVLQQAGVKSSVYSNSNYGNLK